MEKEPDTTNVAYMDEYPHLSDKVRLRRLARAAGSEESKLLKFEQPSRQDIAKKMARVIVTNERIMQEDQGQ